jgi:dipeptidyl aminopeptidase/acylaminoacyl peptidase
METIPESLFGTMEKVIFRRDNLTLAGHLFKPSDFDDTKVYPTLIVGGAVTMVKEQAPDNYARLLVLHDFVVLTLDYASYGESEGSPRNNENVQGKLKDLKAGVSYLQTLPFVGEIGVLGACTTGGNAAYLAADDDRIAAMAAVVPSRDRSPASWQSSTLRSVLRPRLHFSRPVVLARSEGPTSWHELLEIRGNSAERAIGHGK